MVRQLAASGGLASSHGSKSATRRGASAGTAEEDAANVEKDIPALKISHASIAAETTGIS